MVRQLRIPINAARILLSFIIENKHPHVSKSILGRLRQIGFDEDFLEESFSELTRVHDELFAEETDIKSWPGLSGEFAALFSWLMQDLKTSEISVDFDKDLSRATVQSLADLGIEGPYPPELKLKIHYWVVGAGWSKNAQSSSALVFPLRALSLDKKQAGIAYNGLIRHLQTLEALGLGENPDPDLEMSVSSIAIRIVGLAEALNPAIRENATVALSNQVSKFGASGVKTEIKKEIEKIWHNEALQELVNTRNSIAHVSADQGRAFSDTVNALSGKWIQTIAEFASTLMSAEILFTLQDVSEVKVKQWLNQFRKQLENQNLSSLQSSMPAQFMENLDVGLPSQLVTPLG